MVLFSFPSPLFSRLTPNLFIKIFHDGNVKTPKLQAAIRYHSYCCMKKLLFIVLLAIVLPLFPHAQTPTSCFEIESILVDACGTPEGANEMVLFHVGPAALNTANLVTTWPSNPWRGICQSPTTALKVAAMNRQVVGCGYFLEPVGGVLPPDARVLFITSVNFDTLFHDFSALNDTLWVIFQCAGNTNGHFLNASAVSALRTLTMVFNPPVGCSDAVTYDAANLVDTNGVAGAGPPSGARNGATVNFSWSGTPTYVNDGCKPPYIPLNPNITPAAVTICPGDVINLTSTVSGGNYPYHWSGGLGTFSLDTILNPVYTPAPGENNFYLYLTESSSCDSVKDSIFVMVQPLASVSLGPDTSFCPGYSVLLDAGISASSYLWNTGATGSTLNVTAGGWYSVTGTGACNSDVDSIYVTALPSPVVDAGPDRLLCPGDTITLDAGPGVDTWLWNTGAGTQTISVSTAGVFTVSGDNSCGTAYDTISVLNGSNPTVDAGPDTVICAGTTILLDAGPLADLYVWTTGDTTQTTTISSSGLYVVVGATACGFDTDSILVSAASAAVIDAGPDLNLCPGDSVILDAGPGAATYSWNTSATTQTITVSTAGTYIVNGSDICGNDADTVIVTMLTTAATDLGADIDLCPGLTATLDAGPLADSYTWNTGDTTQTIDVTTGGLYIVIGMNACSADTDSIVVTLLAATVVDAGSDVSICPGDSVVLDAGTGAASYLWSTTETTQAITVNAGGLYIVTGTGVCGNDADTVNVTMLPDPAVDLGPDLTVCPGTSILFDAGAGYSYSWFSGDVTQTVGINVTGNTLVYVTVSNSCGSATDSVMVNVSPTPTIDAGPDATLCPGDTLALSSATTSGSGTLLWTTSGTGSFTSASSLNPSYIAGSDSGSVTLTLTLTDSCGSYSDNLIITMNPAPTGLLTATDTVCYGEIIFLDYTGNATTLLWTGGAGDIADSSLFSTIYTPAMGEDGTVTFHATYTNICGTVTDSVVVWIADSNTADFDWSPSQIYVGTTVQFNNLSGAGNTSYGWNFGDSATSTVSDPSHIYNNPGTYSVTLEGTDAAGCPASVTHSLVVLPADTLIPNVFSPNGDGINDNLVFTLPPLRQFHVQVFDRWGKLMFTSTDIKNSWDGTVNGKPCPEGVYFFELRASLLQAGTIQYAGNATLLR